MEDSTQGWTQLGLFFQNQDTFFDFLKRAGEASLPFLSPSCAPVFLYFICSIILRIMQILKIHRPNAQNLEEQMNKHHQKYFQGLQFS